MANLYSNMVAMICKYKKEKYIINYLECLMLSYLYHFLHIANDAGVIIAQCIYYNLNLLNSCSINSLELGLKTRIFTNTTNL